MSELTKEKIYKKELIAGGATGNNNLERIRSLQNGSGGGTPKEEIKKIGEMPFYDGIIEMASGAIGDNVYLFGGYRGAKTVSNSIYKFNIKNKQFTNIGVLPDSLYWLSSAVIGDNVYLFGGRKKTSSSTTANTDVYKFNATTGIASKLTIGVDKANYTCAVAIGGKIFVLHPDGSNTYTIWYFDTSDNSFTNTTRGFRITSSSMYAIRAISAGGYIYYFYDNKISKYDVENGTLSTLNVTFPEHLQNEAIAVVAGDIYLLGGDSNCVYKFSTESETIELTTLKFEEMLSTASAIGSNIYLFGGQWSDAKTNSIFELKVQL